MRRLWCGAGLVLALLAAPTPQAFAYWVDIQASSDGGKTFSDTAPRVPSGTTAKIKWKSNLPTTASSTIASCKVWSAPTPPSNVWTGLLGVKTTGTITQQTTYTAQCSLAGKVVAKDTIVVTVKAASSTATTNQVAGTGVIIKDIIHTHLDMPNIGPVETFNIGIQNQDAARLNEMLWRVDANLLTDRATLFGIQLPVNVPLPPGQPYEESFTTDCRDWLPEGESCEVKAAVFIGGGAVEGTELFSLSKGVIVGTQSWKVATGARALEAVGRAVGRVMGRMGGDPRPKFEVNAFVANSTLPGGFPDSHLDCSADLCATAVQNNAQYELSATAESGYHFVRWAGGPCNGSTTPQCRFTVLASGPPSIAMFDADPGNIRVRIDGDGSGTVKSQGSLSDPIDCPSDCRSTLPQGTPLNLVASPTNNSTIRWTGCSDSTPTDTTCRVTVTGTSQTITVEFDRPESIQLGDVDGDGTVEAFDASLILRHLGRYRGTTASVLAYHMPLAASELARGDVNGKNGVSVTDANAILRYARGGNFSLGTVGVGPYAAYAGSNIALGRLGSQVSNLSGPITSKELPIFQYCKFDCGFVNVLQNDYNNGAVTLYASDRAQGLEWYGYQVTDENGSYNGDIFDAPTCVAPWVNGASGCGVPTYKIQGTTTYRVVYLQDLLSEYTALVPPAQISASLDTLEISGLPDLMVASAIYTPLVLRTLDVASFSAVVFNLQDAMSAPTTATLKVYRKTAGVWGTPTSLPPRPVSGLSQYAHAVVEWENAWVVPATGIYKFEFCVDPGNPGAVREIDEGSSPRNNCRTIETQTVTLTANNLNSALGTITSDAETDEPDINCGTACSKSFAKYSHVMLRAIPAPAAAFDGWMSGPPGPLPYTVQSRTCPTPAVFTSALWGADRREWTTMSCSGASSQLTLRMTAPGQIRQIRYLPPAIPTTVDHYQEILDVMVRERFARFLYAKRANTSLAALQNPDVASWQNAFNFTPETARELATYLTEGKSIPLPAGTYYGRTGLIVGDFYAGDASGGLLMKGSRQQGITLLLVDSRQWITDPTQKVPEDPMTFPIQYAKASEMAGTVFEASADGSVWTPLYTITGPPAGAYRWRTIDVPSTAAFQYVRMRNPSGKLVVAEFAVTGQSLPAPGGVCGSFGTKDCALLLTDPTTVYGSFGKLGDVVADGQITATDALCILRHAVGLPCQGMVSRADTNKDGKISASDALCALRASVGLTALPCTTSALRSALVEHAGEGYVTVSNVSGGQMGQILNMANAAHGLFTMGRVENPAGAINETVSMTFTAPAGVKIVSITGCDTLSGTTCIVTVNGAEKITVTTIVPQLTMVAPNGGQTLTENTTYAVMWSQNYTPTGGVKLSLLRASDNAVLGTIKGCGAGAPTGVANQFKFVWTVGKNSSGALMSLASGGKYKLRVTDCATSLLDDSNAAFTYKK